MKCNDDQNDKMKTVNRIKKNPKTLKTAGKYSTSDNYFFASGVQWSGI